jgi:ABC-2 type transport system ATP-binding protein
MPAIHIDGLEKMYAAGGRKDPPVHALKPLTLDVEPGEVFGLLGPNGAGKTTLVKLLLGIVWPTSGSADIHGVPIGTTRCKSIVGYLPESHRYPLYLTGGGVLRYFGRLSGLDGATITRRSAELVDIVQMKGWEDTKVKKYSKGMMQRIGLAQALLNDPQVIFLDEPTDGVDPVGRKEIRDVITRLRDQGKTIFLNSHLLSEVEMICSRVAILNKGEMVRIGTVKDLTETGRRYRIEVWAEQEAMFARAIARFAPSDVEKGAATIDVADLHDLNAKIDAIRSEGIMIESIAPVRQSLEELFMTIIGNEKRGR